MSLQEKTTIQTGMIIPYLGGVNVSPPDGWLYCDYSLKDNNSYPELATLISGVYGVSPDPSKFRLPGPMAIMKGNPTLSFSLGEGYKLQTSLHSHSATNTNASIALSSASHSHTMTTPVSNSSTATGHSHGAGNPANGNLDIVNNSGSVYSSTSTSNSSPAYISLAAASTFGQFYADDGHKHTLNTSVPTSNTFATHTHAGTAGTIANTNTHSHTLATSVSISSDVALDTDYPPYILIWHIIKT